VITDRNPATSENDLTPTVGWGTPTLPLLPSALASALANVEVPEWLTDILGSRGATVEALAGDVWAVLPADEGTRERIRNYVLDLIKERSGEVADVLIGRGRPDAIEPLLLHASARSRHSLIRAGLLGDPARVGSLRFGDLLNQRNVGPRTALEAAAILDAAGDGPASGGTVTPAETIAPQAVPAWGEPGSPLLPIGLRRALADERLPGWVRDDLRLPPDATPASLDASVWRGVDVLPPRVRRFVLNLVAYRIDVVRDVHVVETGWPDSVDPASVPWPTRVSNALSREGLLDPGRLEATTYGDLLDLRAMGVKSALDFAAIAEVVTSGGGADVVDHTAIDGLTAAAEEEWADRLRADDPRFRDVAPVYVGSLAALFEDALSNPNGARAHALSRSLPEIRDRAGEIAAEPLDLAFERLLRSVGSTRRQIEIVKARLGWNEIGPLTLQDVGDAFKLTRERVRQVTAKVLDRLVPTYLPQLEVAIQELESAAPITVADARLLLVEKGVSSSPLDPRGVVAVAALLGYEASFHIDAGDGSPWILPAGRAGTAAIFSAARKTAGRVGVSNVDEVQALLAGAGREISAEEVERILRASTKVAFLEDEWFWVPDIPTDRNRLRNVTQRMLCVAARLDLATIRQGVRRRYRFMGIETVPPTSVLGAFYASHPEFVLHEDRTVESAVPLDYRLILGDVDRAFVEVFRSTPTGLMDRAELDEALTKRGINPNTLAVWTSYSPVIDHPAMNVWCLRGANVDPAALEALRAVTATRTRRRRTVAYGWDDDGRISLTVTIGNVHSPVVGIPTAIARYVAGRRFAAVTEDGTPAGSIVVDDGGTSWGYGPFLRRRGAEVGDPLTMRFDLTTEQVLLTVGDEGALENNGEAD
jgi:hypothetical protein